ncbi:hypothetical protein L0668_13500 [Paraglaciecola aquimarina]|uniref:Uncharacterized protein n=1 Tax=Paraglaciecola algarum TaxID=3050085 RepID=A0ABS9D8C5_9ALTE|nr:hypothetical protein [Paraglaciecola sp. G1-23]MCF2949131.1 hypothetical protein [Paraglaciecola sp. G1-23]
MKSVILSLGVLLVSTVSAEELPNASAKVVTELTQYCSEMATEYKIAEKDLKKYMLECVNEELAAEGFRPLVKLDTAL